MIFLLNYNLTQNQGSSGHGYLCIEHLIKLNVIDLVTVFDAILTSSHMREKSQCLYGDLKSNNFRKTAVLKKI